MNLYFLAYVYKGYNSNGSAIDHRTQYYVKCFTTKLTIELLSIKT